MNKSAPIRRRDFFKTAAAGAVFAGAPALVQGALLTPPPQGRRARIATVCQAGLMRKTIDESLKLMMEVADKALAEKPDLLCLPENFATAGYRESARDKAEALNGATIAAATERAKKHNCYIISPCLLARDGNVHNSAVIIGRDGGIVGTYEKACPVTTSPDYTDLEGGVTPGTPDIPVFDLDFGRIGIQICYDIGFPENWELLRKKGAQLVLWPSAYDGGTPLWTYAYLHHYYVVTSVRTGQSRIIDPLGAILVETQKETQYVVRDINLDNIVSHLDWNTSIPDKIKAKYGDRVDVRRANLGSSHFIVEPVDPAITVLALQEEFGFESSFQYHERHRVAYAEIRAGRKPAPQKARHGVRPQWGKF